MRNWLEYLVRTDTDVCEKVKIKMLGFSSCADEIFTS
jgi:hypothetical protein